MHLSISRFRGFLPIAIAATLFATAANAQLKLRNVSPTTQTKPASAAPAATSDSASTEQEAAGKLAAAGWLVLLDRRDWGRAWETASSMFRDSVPLSAWMDGIAKVRENMGTLIERAPAEAAYKTTLAGRPDGQYVTVIFLSKFDKRELQEVVTMVREADGKWRATGYSTR